MYYVSELFQSYTEYLVSKLKLNLSFFCSLFLHLCIYIDAQSTTSMCSTDLYRWWFCDDKDLKLSELNPVGFEFVFNKLTLTLLLYARFDRLCRNKASICLTWCYFTESIQNSGALSQNQNYAFLHFGYWFFHKEEHRTCGSQSRYCM